MKKILLLFTAFIWQQSLFGQGVGINTTTPDPSAALEIRSPAGTNKGLLVPKVSLQSSTDNTTIQLPAPGLLVFNTNFNMDSGAGFYYNDNNIYNPKWKSLSNQFVIPYYEAASNNTTLFQIDSYSSSPTSVAIKGSHGGTGTGVSAFSSAGLGLDVSGGVKIAGNGQSPGTGKMLTSDANGNATWQGLIAFRATGVVGGGSEVIAQNSDSKVAFGIEEYDLGNNYNNANQSPHSTFFAPVNGLYHFDAQATWVTSEKHYTELYIKMTRNGITNDLVANFAYGREGDQTLMVSTNCLLQAGDQVNVFVRQRSFAYMSLFTSSNLTQFSGHLVGRQ